MFCEAGGDFGQSRELLGLVWGYVDQELTDFEIERLEGLLLASEDARRYLVEAMMLHRELGDELGADS